MKTEVSSGTGLPVKTYEGIIQEVAWDRDAWTLLIDGVGSGRRLLQVPAYTRQPQKGHRVRLIGRNPLLGLHIEGIDVFDCSRGQNSIRQLW
jgi:hypothetical protein